MGPQVQRANFPARGILRFLAVAMVSVLLTVDASAHCDSMNGPVVRAAKKALETGDVRYALVWVQEQDIAQIRGAFEKAVAVRKLGREARELADQSFFETLVRIHRAAEGAPYTGLKGEDVQPEPGIAAAESALEKNSVAGLTDELTAALQRGLKESFDRVRKTDGAGVSDVEAGRKHVEAYVRYIHYVEGIHRALSGQGVEAAAVETEHHH